MIFRGEWSGKSCQLRMGTFLDYNRSQEILSGANMEQGPVQWLIAYTFGATAYTKIIFAQCSAEGSQRPGCIWKMEEFHFDWPFPHVKVCFCIMASAKSMFKKLFVWFPPPLRVARGVKRTTQPLTSLVNLCNFHPIWNINIYALTWCFTNAV